MIIIVNMIIIMNMLFRNNLDPSPIMHHLLLLRLLSLQPVNYYLQHADQLLVPQPLVIIVFLFVSLNVLILSLQPVNYYMDHADQLLVPQPFCY